MNGDGGYDDKKNAIINSYISKIKDDNDFRGYKIEAGPGTGKSTLLVGLIERLNDDSSIYVISHMNSAIDSIERKLQVLGKYGIKATTVATFIIENLFIPLVYVIKNNNYSLIEKLNSVFTSFSVNNFFKKVGNHFSEDNLSGQERNIFYVTISYIAQEENYMDMFILLLQQKGVKHIFVDEYFDIDYRLKGVFEKILSIGNIRMLIIGDRNQEIGYAKEKFDLNCDGLVSESLSKTYRFGDSILGYSNSIINSSITDSNRQYSEVINVNNNLTVFIKSNEGYFKGKHNVILLHPAEYDQKHKDIIGGLKKMCEELGYIYKYYEKYICNNYHIKKFISNMINFFASNLKIEYDRDIEFHLGYFLTNASDIKVDLFNRVILLTPESLLNDMIDLFEDIIKIFIFNNRNSESIFTSLCSSLRVLGATKLKNLKNPSLQDVIDTHYNDPDKIIFTVNTIHSAKGKEYDNVILLDNVSLGSQSYAKFSEIIKSDDEDKQHFKRMYYVAITRAKERLFIVNKQTV